MRFFRRGARSRYEHFGVKGVTLANGERRNQLGIRVERNKCPDIAVASDGIGAIAFRADESPNLVNFDVGAIQPSHFLVLDFRTGIANANAKSHVPSGHWLDGTGRTLMSKTGAQKKLAAFPVPSGGSPPGTGRWPVLPNGTAHALRSSG
jgi:hypothetical protein